jgi:hypothetical protein
MTAAASFKVIFGENAKTDVRRLLAKAIDRGMGAIARDALVAAADALTANPLTFGDLVHGTRRRGGVVCHGNRPPFFFRFAVYETERVVFVYRVLAMPSSALDDNSDGV